MILGAGIGQAALTVSTYDGHVTTDIIGRPCIQWWGNTANPGGAEPTTYAEYRPNGSNPDWIPGTIIARTWQSGSYNWTAQAYPNDWTVDGWYGRAKAQRLDNGPLDRVKRRLDR